jgi:hypothetical protein
MTNLSDENTQLAALQTFDPKAFVGDSGVPQDLCNFVLALALVYNDCKDGIFSNLLLTQSNRLVTRNFPALGARIPESKFIM